MKGSSTQLPISHERHQVKEPEVGWSPFEILRSDIDSLFDDFMPNFWNRPSGRLTNLRIRQDLGIPAVDILDEGGKFTISVEMPGVESVDIDVRILDGVLDIRGEKKGSVDQEGAEYHLSERSYGFVQRSFKLPPSIDADNIEASFSNGVLKLVVPKAADAARNARRIDIKSS